MERDSLNQRLMKTSLAELGEHLRVLNEVFPAPTGRAFLAHGRFSPHDNGKAKARR